MDESNIPLSAEDLAAAREVLRVHPELRGIGAEREIAKVHQRWGRHGFELRFGLRKPVTVADQCLLDRFLGRITKEEASRILHDYVHRPVDTSMLEMFFGEMRQVIERYSLFLQAAGKLLLYPNRPPIREEDEEELDQLASQFRGKSSLYKEEIHRVFSYLQESRIAKNMGNVQLNNFVTPTAAELVSNVAEYYQQAWRTIRARAKKYKTRLGYAPGDRAIELFGIVSWTNCPLPQKLLTLLDQEHALARICLPPRMAEPVPTAVENTESAGTPAALLSVNDWSELAIGIDERGRYWALTPAPSTGQVFKKSLAIELNLPGSRWQKVLDVFARSESGATALRKDLIERLDYLPTSDSIERDSRAHPGSIEASLVEPLQVRQTVALSRLTQTLADLRRELGELVSVPNKDRNRNCLRTDGAVVHSGFVARYLLRDRADRVTFGASQ